MATKKTTKRGSAGNAKAVRGRPFEKGHKYAWKPGQSGNPTGGSKAQTLSAAYRHALKEPLPDGSGRTYADAVAETLCKNAVAGDVGAARELADRTEGRPKQTIDLSVEERRRELAERAIEALMIDAGCERDEAIAELARLTPEIRTWIN
jgi:hypothetical protein